MISKLNTMYVSFDPITSAREYGNYSSLKVQPEIMPGKLTLQYQFRKETTSLQYSPLQPILFVKNRTACSFQFKTRSFPANQCV